MCFRETVGRETTKDTIAGQQMGRKAQMQVSGAKD